MDFLAALDIGSNSVKSQVVEVSGAQLRNRAFHSKVTALAAGMQRTADGPLLAADAMERTRCAIAEQVSLIWESFPSCRIICAGTSAVRDACNGREFLDSLVKACGLEESPLLLSGQEEAALTFRGASYGMPADELFFNADPGGGSTELSVGYPGSEPLASHSFQLGAVRWLERYELGGVCSAENLERARREAVDVLRSCHLGYPCRRLSVSGGTGSVAVSLYVGRRLGAEDVKPDLTAPMLEEMLARFSKMTQEERRGLPGMLPGREPVVPAALIIGLSLLEVLGARTLFANYNGLRMGLLARAAFG